MMSSEPLRSSTGRAWVRLLLLAALLLGIGAMHTLGHVQHEAHASTETKGPAPVMAADGLPLSDSEGGHTASDDDQHAAALPDLDPTSICLALGALTATLIGVAALAFVRWPGNPLRSAGPVNRPPPSALPPREGPSLSLLQVLRI
ncbi:DUF6153 family protein [Nocardiopsis alba]|uniref:DUF6153 family protein n=1 Tax=Nocardiopsis alba TaxID=53437 RepID=UPI0033E50C40